MYDAPFYSLMHEFSKRTRASRNEGAVRKLS
jgi:hypothetical protein